MMQKFKRFGRWGAGVLALTLAACASQTAYDEGRLLFEEGRPAEAMVKLEEASRMRPTSAEYKMAYLRAKTAALKALLAQAFEELGQGRFAEAERDFGLALAIDPVDTRIQGGMRQLDTARRQDKLLKEAEQAMRNSDMDGARERVHSILLEQPDHLAALKLSRRLPSVDTRGNTAAAEQLLASAYRKPISIEFKDTPLKTIFEVISKTSGLNFLLDKDVRTDQKASIFLKDSTVEAAVNLTLLTNQLEQRVLDANTILIFPSTQAKLKDYQPLVVRSFYLANAEAKSVATTIKTILKSRDVIVDDKLNMLIMRDTPDAVRMAEKLVTLHDVPDAEVMLDVEILEVKRSKLQELGVRWPEQLTLSALPATTGGSVTLNQLRNLDGNSIGSAVSPLVINAKNQKSDANILANPRIRVRNKEKAKIMIGEKVPNITTTATSTGFVSDSVTYVDVGLKLDVEPTIYLDQEVAIKVSLEVSNIVNQVQSKSGSLAYQIGTRVAQTVLRLKDGENQMLAGLINDEDRRSANKVPGLGDMPLIGRLFGTQSSDDTKTEIVLSITPRVVRSLHRPAADVLEFDSGTESNLASRILNGASSTAKLTPQKGAQESGAVVGSAAKVAITGGGGAPNAIKPATEPVQTPAAAGAQPNAPEGASPVRLSWQGPDQVRTGQRFSVSLMVDSPSGVSRLPIALSFDPEVLKVVQSVEGAFMKQTDGKSSLAVNTDGKGRTFLASARTEGVASGSADLVHVTFEVLGAREMDTRIDIISAAPANAQGSMLETVLPSALMLHVKP
jgi:general secretion pathway protein D